MLSVCFEFFLHFAGKAVNFSKIGVFSVVQYSEQELLELINANGNVPNHVAIIMDGNGRWAKKQGLPRTKGHAAGVESVRAVVRAAAEIGVNVVTLYTFSSENWKRPESEVTALMTLLLQTLTKEVNELDKENVKLTVIGDLAALPAAPKFGIQSTIKRLEKNTGLILNLALSYGSRNEIVQAVQNIADKVANKQLLPQDIDENVIAQHLQTADFGDPELLIRTSGEMRISNFLLWQIAYSEIYITPVLWPDFDKKEFFLAIRNFQSRERRFGKVSEQL